MVCPGCEQRRRIMEIMAQATKEWTRNPTGPNIQEIYSRLRNEAAAAARGELDDGTVRPNS